MITPEQHAEIRRLYFGEHWTVGTIVTNLGVHPDTVRAAIALDTRVIRRGACRRSILDPYLRFIRDTLAQYPRLRATRLYEMLRPRGYGGSANQLRRLVRVLRPQVHVARYRRLVVLPAEEAQVDWARSGRSGSAMARAPSPAS
jgi:transposase